ncbi:MFS transporter [Microbacterium rhizomatis]|uniref:MFS transporter n=1 Tax=Microbacterium rhizomatis TaxID=1631477 RepID=A0A5J5J5P2_9MICO|nr:MFS transporter [Microbacterium rhizomatis]KAA9111372.1 MFS transporter [Microbacterium rhizomatis]
MTRNAAPTKRPEPPFGPRFVVPLLWGTSLNPINSSIIATSLVAVGTAFGVSAGQTALLVAAVYVSSAVAQPAMGRLGAHFGARRVFLCGLGVLFVAGLIGTFAPTFAWLVVSRALIGIGTAAGYPTAMSMIRRRADAAGTGIPGGVLGGISISAQVTAALGLPIGGALVGIWGWPAAFAVNVPLAAIGVAMTLAWIPADGPIVRSSTRELLRALDVVGIALFAAAVVSLIALLSDIRHPVWWFGVVLVAATAALVWWELRSSEPFIDVRTLGSNGSLGRTYLRQMLALTASYTVLYGYVQWLEQGRGLTATGSGLILLPMSIVAAAGAAVISRRALVKGPLIISGVAIIAGGAALLFVDAGTSLVALVGLSLLFGVALGMTSTSNQAALYVQTTADQIGVASGLLRTSSYLGAIFASAVIGLAFPASATDDGLHVAAVTIVGVGAVLLLLILLDRRLPGRGR